MPCGVCKTVQKFKSRPLGKTSAGVIGYATFLSHEHTQSGLQIRVRIGKLVSLFLMQNICCGYSFEHPKHMFKLIGKK